MSQVAHVALRLVSAVAACMAVAAPALAQTVGSEAPPAGPGIGDRLSYAEHKATDILTQPVRDVGLFGRDVPAPLQRASREPYGLGPTWSCADIGSEIAQLDGPLGPEPLSGGGPRESRVAKVAEAGGRAAVNSLIPFRTVVREVSGAAPAERRLEAAIDIGHERRGFLRGVYRARNCDPAAVRPSPQPSVGEHD